LDLGVNQLGTDFAFAARGSFSTPTQEDKTLDVCFLILLNILGMSSYAIHVQNLLVPGKLVSF